MDDDRVWTFEESLWTATAQHYQESIDAECLMVLPNPPFVVSGQQAIEEVKKTPRWDNVTFSEQQVARPQEGLIVVAYHVEAKRGDERYAAYCTSTYRWLSHDNWRVVQHQQMVPLKSAG